MKRRGFTLVMGLYLTTILLVMGMALLSMKLSQYKGAVQVAYGTRASVIAQAGLDDARLKLEKDLLFPPVGDENTMSFTYTEDFYDVDSTTYLGSYQVTVDTSKMTAPYLVVPIWSLGTAGPAASPLARRQLYAELDLSSTLRSNPAAPNPTFYRFVNWQDLGGL